MFPCSYLAPALEDQWAVQKNERAHTLDRNLGSDGCFDRMLECDESRFVGAQFALVGEGVVNMKPLTFELFV